MPHSSVLRKDSEGAYKQDGELAPITLSGNSIATRREERPISKRQPLRVPNGYHRRGSGATVRDSHEGPLMNRENPIFH
jgi:hypothetical protein